MTLETFRKHLAQEAKTLGSQRNLAKKYGVSPMFICDILSGRRDPGEKLLTAMGFNRTVIIRRSVKIERRS